MFMFVKIPEGNSFWGRFKIAFISSVAGILLLLILCGLFIAPENPGEMVAGLLIYFLPVWFLIAAVLNETVYRFKIFRFLKLFFLNKLLVIIFMTLLCLLAFLSQNTAVYITLFDIMTYCCFILSITGMIHYMFNNRPNES